jgi:branched-chain amino acid transport system substrate-binding protein
MSRSFRARITNVALTTQQRRRQWVCGQLHAAFTDAGRHHRHHRASWRTVKPDYAAEVASLAASAPTCSWVAGYSDQGGKGIIQNSLDTGAFETFYLPDGMVGQQLATDIARGSTTRSGRSSRHRQRGLGALP